jgi:photosynthetic reaction center cytochrome c subunit
MAPISRRHSGRIAFLLACAFLTAFLVTAVAQEQSAPPKTAVQQFKNIQVLKDIPADQLIPTMQFIAGALGVECEFCHVEHAMDKDDKKEKQIARKMMAMELTINADHFENHIEVTCYTCHRGTPHPVGIPVLSADAMKMEPHEHHEGDAHESLPTSDQILDKYLAAVGGADALHKIKTRVQKGTIDAMGQQYPVEVYSEGPEKRVSISHPSFGDSVTAFNGQVGWLSTPRGPHVMSAQENQAARIDAQLYFPARLRELYPEFHVLPGEPIGGHATVLLAAEGAGTPPLRLYFDQQSGLLLRLIRYAQTPLGRNPSQIDYADYRDTGGVKIPYQWTLTRTNGTFTIRINSVQQNVSIDPKLFVMPPPPPPPPDAPHP